MDSHVLDANAVSVYHFELRMKKFKNRPALFLAQTKDLIYYYSYKTLFQAKTLFQVILYKY